MRMRFTARRKLGRPATATGVGARQRIVNAARNEFIEMGYAAATIQTIATRADLTRPAVSYHFSGKRELYLEAIQHPAAAVIDAAAAAARRSETLSTQLSNFFSAAIVAGETDGCTARLVLTAMRESVVNTGLAPEGKDVLHSVRTFVASAVYDAIDRSELSITTDVLIVAESMVAVFCGIGVYAGSLGSAENLATIVDSIELLLRPDHAWYTPANDSSDV
jgi:AcrR family transcriptional regulator